MIRIVHSNLSIKINEKIQMRHTAIISEFISINDTYCVYVSQTFHHFYCPFALTNSFVPKEETCCQVQPPIYGLCSVLIRFQTLFDEMFPSKPIVECIVPSFKIIKFPSICVYFPTHLCSSSVDTIQQLVRNRRWTKMG